ncbi:alkaline phosphatase family protein [Pontibaca salina]|uniref:Alkaline phosphatase family protein n=1 Tax=Pontibaca salina TaxID=2795731 RepID=A0A934M2B0_9RHOB|nr:alkaline phosphatase family protein [Pontibaca salina]MBI6630461.1 alkaline phosphatase family protein [Pontibaca salina]
MQNKIILVIMDGAGYEACVTQCGYLEGAVELGQAQRWKMITATPTLSGPMYETIHTGLWPHEHGITSNEGMRASERPNVFSLAREADKTTAAVAHAYYHRLYVDRPWDGLRSVEHHDPETDIQHARFYSMEGYGAMNAVAPAEIDLCAQVTLLAEHHAPDYLLLHSCSADTLGHSFGGDSKEYRYQIWMIDNALSRAIPIWRAMGYDVMVTADHGMNAEQHHGGMEKIMREVPFYYFGEAKGPNPGKSLSQLGLAATILDRLGVTPDAAMRPGFL